MSQSLPGDARVVIIGGGVVGEATSAGFGYASGRAVAMGYVGGDAWEPRVDWRDVLATGRYELLVAGRRVGARASLRPPYDPQALRPRV